MKVMAPNGYCDGCIWASVIVRGKMVYCPFAQCKRQTLAAVENNNVAKRKLASER